MKQKLTIQIMKRSDLHPIEQIVLLIIIVGTFTFLIIENLLT